MHVTSNFLWEMELNLCLFSFRVFQIHAFFHVMCVPLTVKILQNKCQEIPKEIESIGVKLTYDRGCYKHF